TVNTSSFASDTLSICDSDLPITYGDSIFPVGTTTGFYQIVFSLPNGGDSTVTLLLFVNNTYNLFDTLSICDSDLPFQYGDSIFPIATLSGDYPVLFTSYYGCDSLINLHLNVNPTYLIYDTLSICENELPYTYTDTIFNIGTISGTYNFCRQSIYGCDSITLLFLTVNPVYNFTDTHTLCESELPFSYAGQSFDSAGSYSINLLSQFGCDSNILLTIYVLPSYKETQFLKICDSELPYFYAGYRLDLGGTYNLKLKNNNGCDSLITLFLAVNTTPFQPDAIIGNPYINIQGQYTFSVNPIDNATSYQWHITNPEWRGNSTTNVISIFIPNPGNGTIAISAINECGESDKTELYLTSSVGTKDYDSEQKIILYPNPAVSFTYINFKEIKGNTNIRITDVSGKILHNEVYNINEIQYTLKLDISKYPKGFYFITINNNDQTVIKKLIIE
ncbi:MAG: T9SS type A sorting domain-containing protein, partial [Bacteroidales bacterium]